VLLQDWLSRVAVGDWYLSQRLFALQGEALFDAFARD
jgi:hypothetical protein